MFKNLGYVILHLYACCACFEVGGIHVFTVVVCRIRDMFLTKFLQARFVPCFFRRKRLFILCAVVTLRCMSYCSSELQAYIIFTDPLTLVLTSSLHTNCCLPLQHLCKYTDAYLPSDFAPGSYIHVCVSSRCMQPPMLTCPASLQRPYKAVSSYTGARSHQLCQKGTKSAAWPLVSRSVYPTAKCSMYVCMCVYMYVCVYVLLGLDFEYFVRCSIYPVCMHVCMHVCMYILLGLDFWDFGTMLNISSMYACMHVCMYVCIYCLALISETLVRCSIYPTAKYGKYVCINSYIHTYIYTYTNLCTYDTSAAQLLVACIHTHTHKALCIYTSIHACIHIPCTQLIKQVS